MKIPMTQLLASAVFLRSVAKRTAVHALWIALLLAFSVLSSAALAQPLPPPPGYSASQLVFDDQFLLPALDSTKWIPQIADAFGIWRQSVPPPYSAPNSGSFSVAYFDPFPQQGSDTTGPHVVTGNGLRLIATPSRMFKGYSWAGGVVCTHGLFYFTGGYVQFRAKMPDSRTGMWAALWFLEGGGEIDLQESGFLLGSSNVNHVMAMNFHATGGIQHLLDTGIDLSADYHVYGVEYKPGQSLRIYLDNVLMATYRQNIPTGAYEILMDLEVAGSLATGWHTVASPNTSNPGEFDVSEVQVYHLP